MRSNLRWCSDVFEITCWNGDIVRIVFVIDAHDREVLAWHAGAGTGISGSIVRDPMLEEVELRFGTVQGAANKSNSPTGRAIGRPWQSGCRC